MEIENGACPPELTCDFEESYCGFYNTKEGDDIDWERNQGVVSPPSTGNQKYLFISNYFNKKYKKNLK